MDWSIWCSMKAIIESEDNSAPKVEAIPAELQARAEELREAVMEAAAEANDELMMKYLDEGTLSDAEIVSGLAGSDPRRTRLSGAGRRRIQELRHRLLARYLVA